MATVGRNRAVADMPGFKLRGFVAWTLWSFVHLFTIMGVKNRLSIFLNWSWNYFTYDQSLRLLIKPKQLSKLIINTKTDNESSEQIEKLTNTHLPLDIFSKLTSN